MRLTQIRVRNFRCYREETVLNLDDFTAVIGANDAGKSTFLDAMAIFFEEKKMDQGDATVEGDPRDVSIICKFDELPETIVLDSTNTTTFEAEYLLNEDEQFEMHKTFDATKKTVKPRIQLRAVHPSAEHVGDLLKLKNSQLKDRCGKLGIDLTGVDQKVNAELRKAIRDHVAQLQPILQPIEMDLPGTKEMFPKILEQLPAFYLFSADRASTDQDSEAQNPMKAAVRQALDQETSTLNQISENVTESISNLTNRTLERVIAMSPELAGDLSPQILPPKWDSVFKVSLNSDNGIPLNKRGSGVRRLILLGFLQAQAEIARLQTPSRRIIYAVEEPETSQHPDKQRALLNALREVATNDGYQVLVTTHTPNLARLLAANSLRFIQKIESKRHVLSGEEEQTKELIRKALGVHPDHDVRLFICIEGIHDESFLLKASEILAEAHPGIQPLQQFVDDGKVIFVPLGGGNLTNWVARLQNLERPEFHIYDRDEEPPKPPHYDEEANAVNERDGCTAVHTGKREMENYLHYEAVMSAKPGIRLDPFKEFDDVPKLVAEAIVRHKATEDWDRLSPKHQKNRTKNIKSFLNNDAVNEMTPQLFADSDPDEDLATWLKEIAVLANT